MKKGKFLVGTMILSAALLGTGYAAWNDTLELTTTVNTGILDMQFIESTMTRENYVDMYKVKKEGNTYKKEAVSGVSTATSDITVTGITAQEADLDATILKDKITFNTDNLYPGEKVVYTVKFKNEGSVPTQLDLKSGIIFKKESKEVLDIEVDSTKAIKGVISTIPGESTELTISITMKKTAGNAEQIKGYEPSATFLWTQPVAAPVPAPVPAPVSIVE